MPSYAEFVVGLVANDLATHAAGLVRCGRFDSNRVQSVRRSPMSATAHQRRWDGPDFLQGQCSTCRHYRFAATCDAYPRGIPPEILGDYGSHKRPQPGDNGIWWEPTPPDTTDGPVRYAMAHQLIDGRSVITGAIWAGLEDGSIGWCPAPDFMGTPTSMAWLGSLRAAWRSGRTA